MFSIVFGLYDLIFEYSVCGVGFLMCKDFVQIYDVLLKGYEVLCVVLYCGGMLFEGVGDGVGILVDLLLYFFCKLMGVVLQLGGFGVGNFFLFVDLVQYDWVVGLIDVVLCEVGMQILLVCEVLVDFLVILLCVVCCQLMIW